MKKKYKLTMLLFCGVIALNAQQIKTSWITSVGSPGWDVVADIAINNEIGIYVFGAYYDSISFNSKKLYSEGSRDLFLARYNTMGICESAFSFGGTGFDYPIKVKAIGPKQVVVAFKHNQPVKVASKIVSGNFINTYSIAWLNKDNKVSNSFSIAATGNSSLTDIGIARDSCIWVTGWFEDSLQVAGKIYISKSKEDIYLARFTKQGSLKWFTQYGGEGSDKAQILCAMSDSSMYISGTTTTGCFGKSFVPDSANKSGDYLFLGEVSASGTIKKITYPASGYDIIPAGIVQADSAIWIATSFSGNVRVNKTSLECKGKRNILLLWEVKSGINWNYQHWEGNLLAIPISFSKLRNDLMISGFYSGKINFSDTEIDSTSGGTDVFLLTLSQTGHINKIFVMKGKGLNFPSAVAIQGQYVYVAGEFSGNFESESGILKSNSNEDVFLAQYIECYLANDIGVDLRINQIGGITYYDLKAEAGFDSYRWNNTENTSPYFSTTLAGTYTVEVTDTLGCPHSKKILISPVIENMQENKTLSTKNFKIYPTITNKTVFWEPDSSWNLDSAITVAVFNSLGSEISTGTIQATIEGTNAIDVSTYANGVYYIKIAGSNFNQESTIVVRR